MDKVIELARKSGLSVAEHFYAVAGSTDNLQKFYTLARADLQHEYEVLSTSAGNLSARMADLEAEIAGWKADQKENLANQCELQAEINRLEAENAKLRDRHDEISNALFRKGANTRRLKVENAKLKAAVQLIATAENSALDLAYCKGVARAALGEK